MARVMLFARRPRAGRVKTRLARSIGDEATLALYRAFLADLLAGLGALAPDHEPELWLDGPWRPSLDGMPPAGVTLQRQVDGPLGERLAHAVRCAARQDAMPAVLLGADAPTLPFGRVEDAIAMLTAGRDAPDVVVEPADDGGYVLLGLRRHVPALFERIDWGGPAVLAQTLERAADAGARVRIGEGWYDVDDRRGLARLRRELHGAAAAASAPRTARTLASLYPELGDVV